MLTHVYESERLRYGRFTAVIRRYATKYQFGFLQINLRPLRSKILKFWIVVNTITLFLNLYSFAHCRRLSLLTGFLRVANFTRLEYRIMTRPYGLPYLTLNLFTYKFVNLFEINAFSIPSVQPSPRFFSKLL